MKQKRFIIPVIAISAVAGFVLVKRSSKHDTVSADGPARHEESSRPGIERPSNTASTNSISHAATAHPITKNEQSQDASLSNEQKADRLLELVKDETSSFSKDFDIEKTTCSGNVCRIEAQAHPGASPGNATVVMQFVTAHPEFGNNWNLELGQGQEVVFSISPEPFKN